MAGKCFFLGGGEKWPVDSADTLKVKNFIEIALSCTISEINVFLHFTQKFKMAAKNSRNRFFLEKVASRLYRYPGGKKFWRKRSIWHRFPDKCVFALYAEIQDGHQKWRENNFGEKSPVDSADTLRSKISCKSLSHTVSQINEFFYVLRRNSRWPPTLAGK